MHLSAPRRARAAWVVWRETRITPLAACGKPSEASKGKHNTRRNSLEHVCGLKSLDPRLGKRNRGVTPDATVQAGPDPVEPGTAERQGRAETRDSLARFGSAAPRGRQRRGPLRRPERPREPSPVPPGG